MIVGLFVAANMYGVELVDRAVLYSFHRTEYAGESFSTQAVGARSYWDCHDKIRCSVRLKLGYEHHYESSHYAQSYTTAEPSFGVEFFSVTPVSAGFFYTPAKFFHKLSAESQFERTGVRADPIVQLHFRYDIESKKSINPFAK